MDCTAGQLAGHMSGPNSSLNLQRDQNLKEFYAFDEETALNRLTSQWMQKKDYSHSVRHDVQHTARQIVVDVVTQEFMCDDRETAVARVYLMDRVFPSLVLGLEKLLTEVQKHHYAEHEMPVNSFNPINFLGQFLMRNNPKYCNFGEASSYVRGLRGASEQIKLELFHLTENKLSNMKAQIQKKREERELELAASVEEMSRRQQLIEKQFYDWNDGHKVELLLVWNALKAFEGDELLIPKQYEQTEEYDKAVYLADYITYLHQYVGQSLTKSSFDQLVAHMSQCISIHRRSVMLRRQATILSGVFDFCDSAKDGVIDRQRLLTLLNMFYGKVPLCVRNCLAKPIFTAYAEELERGDYEELSEKIDSEQDLKVSVAAFEATTDDEAEGRSVLSDDQKVSSGLVEHLIFATSVSVDAMDLDHRITNDKNCRQDVDVRGISATELPEQEIKSFEDRESEMSSLDHGLFALIHDSRTISSAQFVLLLELFLHKTRDESIVEQVSTYIREGFGSRSCAPRSFKDEKSLSRFSSDNVEKLIELFDAWDNDSSTFISFDFLECTLSRYRNVNLSDAIRAAKHSMQDMLTVSDGRLSVVDFCNFVTEVMKLSLISEGAVDNLIGFLHSCISVSPEEKERGKERKLWLTSIKAAADSTLINMEPIYNELFGTLYKDAGKYGSGKVISAAVALVEPNNNESRHGRCLLRYVASSRDQADLLGKVFYEDQQEICFACINSGKPIHVPNIASHGDTYFSQLRETYGSFVVVPLQEQQVGVFGVMTVFTCRKESRTSVQRSVENDAALFTHHEIDFYQGLASAFSAAFHIVRRKKVGCLVIQRAVSWYQHRCMHIKRVDAYSVLRLSSNCLQHMFTSTNIQGKIEVLSRPVKFSRTENLFRDYLFRCAEVSEPLVTNVFDQNHFVVPLRDEKGCAAVILDFNCGDCIALPPLERQLFIMTIKLLQAAFADDLQETHKAQDILQSGEAVFDYLLFLKLRNQLSSFDHSDYELLKQRACSSVAIQNVVKCVAAFIFPETASSHDSSSWLDCIQLLENWRQKFSQYLPSVKNTDHRLLLVAEELIKDVLYGDLLSTKSKLACCLYNFVSTCVSLMNQKFIDGEQIQHSYHVVDSATDLHLED